MRARLTFTEYDGKAATFELDGDAPALIGRSRENSLILRDEHASRMHSRIHFDNGRWLLRNFGLNGTKLNGVKIDEDAELNHGDEIRIGETCLKFIQLDTNTSAIAGQHVPQVNDSRSMPRLPQDDQSVMCSFLAGAVAEKDHIALVRNAIEIVLHQTSADQVAFLSDDPNEPITKVIFPETARVDPVLSRQLNRRAKREAQPIWLCCDLAETRMPESMSQFSDALCLPVLTPSDWFGMVQVYRRDAYFTERDLRFCEALVAHLAELLTSLYARRAQQSEIDRLKGRVSAGDELVGDSQRMRDIRQMIDRFGSKPLPILIRGEAGTGKELVANNLHARSSRANGPFVTVDCSGIPGSLLEAELFGYRKGAFSGADKEHAGVLQQAAEGTLYLDEVAELSLDCQTKLLRAIQTKQIRPVGAGGEIVCDVRILAGTRRDLQAEVTAGRFRQELLDVLKTVTIEVPPLRDHVEDLPHLVQYFLDRCRADFHRHPQLTPAAVAQMQKHDWHGNVRQLRAMLESAALQSRAESIDVADLRLETASEKGNLPLNLNQLEQWAIIEAMSRTQGNKAAAARLLGISRDTMHTKWERYGQVRTENQA